MVSPHSEQLDLGPSLLMAELFSGARFTFKLQRRLWRVLTVLAVSTIGMWMPKEMQRGTFGSGSSPRQPFGKVFYRLYLEKSPATAGLFATLVNLTPDASLV
jgi:hypothetical protein